MEGGVTTPGSALGSPAEETRLAGRGSCREDAARLRGQQAGSAPSFPPPPGLLNGCKKSLLLPPSLVMPGAVDVLFS